jgi:hypothetical protein
VLGTVNFGGIHVGEEFTRCFARCFAHSVVPKLKGPRLRAAGILAAGSSAHAHARPRRVDAALPTYEKAWASTSLCCYDHINLYVYHDTLSCAT